MKKLLSAGAALMCLVVLSSAPVRAAQTQPWEAGIGAGWINPDDDRKVDSDVGGLLTIGKRFDRHWGGELFGMFGNDINLIGARGLYHFDEPFFGWTPYVSAGLGFTNPDPGRTDTTLLVGAGLKKPIDDNLGLRAEVNAHQGFDSGSMDMSLFFAVTWSWGAPARSR